MGMAGPIPLQSTVYVQYYALGKYIEFPTHARKEPAGRVQYTSFIHISTQFMRVRHCPGDNEWNPEKFGTLWVMENEVELYTRGHRYEGKRKTFWFPFAWATELEDACNIAQYVRPGNPIRIVHALTHEEIPLHVL